MRLRHLSTTAAHLDGIPMRQYIENMLYSPKIGYFNTPTAPVMSHAEPRRFSSFENRSQYERYVASTFALGQQHGWCTPSELFTPYLGRAVARRILSTKANVVIEFGGGRGTLASDVLKYIEENHPVEFQRFEYHLVDISHNLVNRQHVAVSPWASKTTVHCAHARDWLCTEAKSIVGDKQAHILAFELLDNLPHDLVRFSDNGDSMQQAYMHASENEKPQLEWKDGIDVKTENAHIDFELSQNQQVSSLLGVFRHTIDGGVQHVWVPTVLHEILDSISEHVPEASLTLADFTSFPGALAHRNGPVIQRVERGIAKVFDSVEDAPLGEVDVMFPTDFEQLRRAYRTIWQKRNKGDVNANVLSQQLFFREYAAKGDIFDSTCSDGYNPILQDFTNASVFAVDKATVIK